MVQRIIHKFVVLFSSRGRFFLMQLIKGFIISLLPNKNKKIWLISERENEARDNGYHLFRYIREHYPEEKVYYVINPKSYDYNKIKKYGNVIAFGSLMHHKYYQTALCHISTHLNGCCPSLDAYKYIPLKHKSKEIFIQHGLLKDRIYGLSKEEAKLDLLVCGGKNEFEFVKQTQGYLGNEVQYLGLCRFDALHSYKTKKQILIMPTFRMNYFISEHQRINNKRREIFLNSKYFKTYNNLLNTVELSDVLADSGYNLIFYPHYETQKYIDCFKCQSKNIIIAEASKYDVQTLLKESELLITDYSSIFFDFAYMKKPLIYFQFDENHYEKGYFSYELDGFGPIVSDIGDLLTEVKRLISNQCEMTEKYLERRNAFFELDDTNNCERNYLAIKKVCNGSEK